MLNVPDLNDVITDTDRLNFLSKFIKLDGKEYVPYEPFRVLYNQEQPLTTIYKTGRQVSKTTSVTIQHLIQTASKPYFRILYVTPLSSQADRTSVSVLRPILETSPIALLNPLTRKKVRGYSFANGATIDFSYAYLNEDRVRGHPADKLHIDEVQDLNHNFLPTIIECLSASDWHQIIYTGTPRTYNNTAQFLWLSSSQAEWVIKCEHCNHHNIPSIEHDLDKIIGNYRDDISEDRPATICAKCGKIIYPQTGQWVHAYPERQWTTAGYHVPQVIIKNHYANPINWSILLDKRAGGQLFTPAKFYQEVLGEAYDVSEHLLSLADVLKYATLGDRTDINTILKLIPRYYLTAFGIDWGGGGEGGNFTTIAYAGLTQEGIIEIPWATSLLTPHDHLREAQEIMKLLDIFQPRIIAHDYSGAGSLRETILIHSGIPPERIMPCRYVPSNMGLACRFVPATDHHPRNCFHIEPNRCLLLLIGAIKLGQIRFFKDDYVNENNTGLLRHLLSLIDISTQQGVIDHFRIGCEPGYRDEFAQAAMLACLALWQATNRWPRFNI